MKYFSSRRRIFLCLLLLGCSCGCKKMSPRHGGWGGKLGGVAPDAAESLGDHDGLTTLPARADNPATANRKLVWTGGLALEVENVTNAAARAAQAVEKMGGYVESQAVDDNDHAALSLRVPAARLATAICDLSSLGTVRTARVSSRDVSEEYVDTEARMKNAKALRDRLQELLGKATNVTEILSVERELSRLQAEIESAEARIRVLGAQVELASLQLDLHRRTPPAQSRIYGPLGLLWHGLTWFVEKLFVIR